MENDFVITPKDEVSIQISIRIEKRICDNFDELSRKSGHSRNHLINQALDFALKNAKFIENE